MRLLLTSDPMLPVPPTLYGGIERIIASLAEKLQRRGHAVGLVADGASTCQGVELFPWPALPATKRHALHFAGTLSHAVRRFRPDVLHSFSRLLYLLPLLPQRLPKIMSFQREPTPHTIRWASRLAGRSLHFTGCSDYISARGRSAGGNWTTIHNFVDVDQYTFVEEVSDEAPLVFLSRIEAIKGTHVAIEACRRARRNLVIAGNRSEGDDEARNYWREQIEPQIEGDRVRYIGPVNDEQKNELLGGAAAMIVPIQWEEPFGIVFAEALACGAPIISCPRGALPEIVRNSIEGFLVNSTDEVVLAINRLDHIDRAGCRRRAEERFSAEAVVPQYESLYQRITESSRA